MDGWMDVFWGCGSGFCTRPAAAVGVMLPNAPLSKAHDVMRAALHLASFTLQARHFRVRLPESRVVILARCRWPVVL
jgi:hypothetical protein